MAIPDNVMLTIIEQIRQIQISLRHVRSDLEKWRQETAEMTTPPVREEVEPPTDKQIQFLKGLGVEEIPASKIEARRLLQELNEKRETGEYSIPPTAAQLKYLRDLKYAGEMPRTKDDAWKILQELKKG
jgi:hypothetical protein